MSSSFLKKFSFGQQMNSVPIIFFIGAIALLISFSWQIGYLSKFSASVNLAGRQRMLNQRHAREVLEAGCGDKSNYNATRKLLIESVTALRNGADHEFGTILPARDQNLVEGLVEQEKSFRKTFETADRYLTAVRTENSKDKQTKLRAQFIAETNEAHKAAHGVVLALVGLSKNSLRSSSFFAYGMGAVVVAFCSLWAVFIGRSATGVIRESARSFSRLSKEKLYKISTGLRQNAVSTSEQAHQASGAAEQVSSNAGPNCIRKDCIPEDAYKTRRQGPSKCTAANGQPMATSGIIDAWVNLRGYITRTQFVICDALP